MYNLANLNDYEFEMLCKDIMEVKLQVKLHRFKRGKDQGIDLRDSDEDLKYMIQVKHFNDSSYSDLKRNIMKEVPNVKNNNPKNYYICVSKELTPKRRKEIFLMFKDYMKDLSNIIDKTDIDDFLAKEENKDIVQKNYKLWLCSSNVLTLIQNKNVFIDCEEILNEINDYAKLFVNTKAYFDCCNSLIKNNLIIIVGNPGVGKSTISKMLLLYFASKDFAVRYTSDNNIKDIKKILCSDPAKKEIVLLDDFLGQHYLNISDKEPNELKALISYIEKNPNKKLILNSRITIINEANYSSIAFSNLMEQCEDKNYLIDLNKMSFWEKAKILYNHIYFNNLPEEYMLEFRMNKNYALIIKHKNYNPRIIEYVTKPKNYLSVKPQDYINYILEKLDNPDKVWEDEFRNRLEEEDRILLNTLYSLTNTKIELDVLKNAFNKRILNNINKTTLNTFLEVINRLTNSLIKIEIFNNKRFILVVNNSLNDFLKKKIENNINEQINIIKNAYYIEQIEKFKNNKEIIYEMIYNNTLSKLKVINYTNSFYYLNLIIDYDLRDIKIKDYVEEVFKDFIINFKFGYEDLLIDLIKNGMVKFYNLEDIIFNNLDRFLKCLSYDNILYLNDALIKEKHKLNKEELDTFKNNLIEAFERCLIEQIDMNLYDIISRKVRILNINIDKNKPYQFYIDKYYPLIKEKIEQDIYEMIPSILGDGSFLIKEEDIHYDFIFNSINTENEFALFIVDKLAKWTAEYIDNNSLEENDEWEKIDDLFR